MSDKEKQLKEEPLKEEQLEKVSGGLPKAVFPALDPTKPGPVVTGTPGNPLTPNNNENDVYRCPDATPGLSCPEDPTIRCPE